MYSGSRNPSAKPYPYSDLRLLSISPSHTMLRLQDLLGQTMPGGGEKSLVEIS